MYYESFTIFGLFGLLSPILRTENTENLVFGSIFDVWKNAKNFEKNGHNYDKKTKTLRIYQSIM